MFIYFLTHESTLLTPLTLPRQLQERLGWLTSVYVYSRGEVVLPSSLVNDYRFDERALFETKYAVFARHASPSEILPGDLLINLNGVPEDKRFTVVEWENLGDIIREHANNKLMTDHESGEVAPQYLLVRNPEHEQMRQSMRTNHLN